MLAHELSVTTDMKRQILVFMMLNPIFNHLYNLLVSRNNSIWLMTRGTLACSKSWNFYTFIVASRLWHIQSYKFCPTDPRDEKLCFELQRGKYRSIRVFAKRQ